MIDTHMFKIIHALGVVRRVLRRIWFILLAKLMRQQVVVGSRLNIDHGFKLYVNGTGFTVRVGDHLGVRRNFSLMISDSAKLLVGNNVFFNNNCSISCHKYISIGNDCLFGENVKLYDHNHRFDPGLGVFRAQGFNDGQIVIGNNVWVGSNVTILNDVTIGDNVVVGANCLIYKNIESNSVVKCKQELIGNSLVTERLPIVTKDSSNGAEELRL